MKILQLLFEYEPYYGGATRIARGLSEELVRRGHEVSVIAVSYGSEYGHRAINGVDVHLIPFPQQIRGGKRENAMALFTRLGMELLTTANKLQKSAQFDLVHAHHYLAGYACQSLKESEDVPLIATIHGLYTSQYGPLDDYSDVYSPRQNWKNGYYTALADNVGQIEIQLCKLADAVICVSNSVFNEVRHYVHDDKLRVVYNFIDSSRVKTGRDIVRWRRRFATDEEQIVLVVGRVEYSKGGDIVLEIAKEMSKRNEKIQFVLAGNVWMDVRHEKIQTLGHLGEEELHACYEMCDLVILPSRYEAFNLVACEAMAHRKTVLGYDAWGLREVIRDGVTGRLMNTLRPTAWVKEICKLLGDTNLLARWGTQGHKHVRERFDMRQQVDKYEDMYQTVREGRRFSKVYDRNGSYDKERGGILMLTEEYPPKIWGGLGRAVHTLSTGIADHSAYKVTVLTLVWAGEEIVNEVVDGIRIIRFPGSTYWANTELDVHRVMDYLKRTFSSFELVHAHSVNLYKLAVSLKNAYQIPLIYTSHSILRHEVENIAEDGCMQGYARQEALLWNADQVLCCSNAEKDVICRYYPLIKEKIKIVHNGILFSGEYRRSIFSGQGKILFAGRGVRHKGLIRLIDSMRTVLEVFPEAFLTITGGHGDNAYIQTVKDHITELGLSSRVRILDWVEEAELEHLYSEADVVVMPSEYEPFGSVALEALNYGIPMVLSDRAGVTEIVQEDTGLRRVDPEDAGEIAEAIIAIFSNYEQAKENIIESREKLRKSPNRMALETVGIYETVLRRQRTAT